METLHVECYSGFRADERPVRFTLGSREFRVERLDDKWYSPGAAFFRVFASDGNLYVLRHDECADSWTIEAFRRLAP